MPLTTDPVAARTFAIFDARLQHDVSHPVALALSGGGDSVALLGLAADWARLRGRRLLALTVDHGLQAESADWSRFAARAAADAGADWRGLVWSGDKPAAGITAAARSARHALLADAARQAGARVILLAHTADDIAEADWMRAEGSTLGQVREWSPSPAWPQGRGLMLLRPLLGQQRSGLRSWLRARGSAWLEDPANQDARFGRARARLALSLDPRPGAARPANAHELPVAEGTAPSMPSATYFADAGAILLRRGAGERVLGAAVVCAGGGTLPPRGGRLSRLAARLSSGETFTAVLCGARITASFDTVLIHREAGEWRRRPLSPLPLHPDVPTVWDGRFELEVSQPGWCVVPALGWMAQLEAGDRAILNRLPASLRPSLPVLIRDDETGPVLAGCRARARCLVSRRFNLFLGEVTHETGLVASNDGASPDADLFLFHDGAFAPNRVTRGLR